MFVTLEKGKPWEYPDNTGSGAIISKNATVDHRQQANDTYGKAC